MVRGEPNLLRLLLPVQRRQARLRIRQDAPFSALTAVVSSSGRSFAEASATWAHLSPKLAQMLSVHRRKFVHALCQEWELATAAVVCAVTDTRSGQVGCCRGRAWGDGDPRN